MYDWPEVRWATDQLWDHIRLELTLAGLVPPEELERSRHADAVWTDPHLLLSQTCGWPYVTRLAGRVRLLATPVYDAEGCSGPLYSSAIIARRGEYRSLAGLTGGSAGVNGRDSMSGYVALFDALRSAGIGLPDVRVEKTGSHRASIRSVAEGKVDFAAIDAVCWALAADYEPDAVAALEVVAWTPLRPGLPLITSLERSEAEIGTIRGAVAQAIGAPAMAEARAALHLSGLAVLPDSDYTPLRTLAA
jgi:ABC-type phosphate/phosphonate transport system substrate-binding protein